MFKHLQTQSSINQIFSMLKNYFNNSKGKQIISDIKFDSKFTSQHPQNLQSITQLLLTNRNEQSQEHIPMNTSMDYKKDKSFDNKSKPRHPLKTIHYQKKKEESSQRQQAKKNETDYLNTTTSQSGRKNIFDKLYDENVELRAKRQRLITQGRNSIEKSQRKQCTFSPRIKSSKKAEKVCTLNSIETFYKKNVQWQKQKEKNIKEKQCEINENRMSQLTFTPKTNGGKKLDHILNGEVLLELNGLQGYLNRQNKAKNKGGQLLQARKKQLWNPNCTYKRGQFSYKH